MQNDESAVDADLPWVYPDATRNALCGFRHCDLMDGRGDPCTFIHTSRRERIRARSAWWVHRNQAKRKAEETEEAGGSGRQRKRVRRSKQ